MRLAVPTAEFGCVADDRTSTRVQALKEIEQGKTFGPFNCANDLIRSLNQEAKKLKKKAS